MEVKVLSVSQLTEKIRQVLDLSVGFITVEGEISNFKLHTSGHRYFTLKDDFSQIACVFWKGRQLPWQISDGMKVRITGNITVFAPRGNYQIDCASILPVGQGDLFLAFEALKAKLDEKGYFSRDIKKPLPRLPLKIAVATSPTGAAIRDIFSTLGRRFPAMTIYFRPTVVQGAEAAGDVVAAINDLSKTDAELMIIGRGGGSIEDLWAFNMEIVADAIFNCKIPIISAVGHETDFTIADFVADVRAATPTAAAELSTPVTFEELLSIFDHAKEDMTTAIMERINEKHEILKEFSDLPLRNRIIQRLRNGGQLLDQLQYRVAQGIAYKFGSLKEKISVVEKMMRSNYPLGPLKKGFAILKHNQMVIPNSVSLSGMKNIDIIRENETVNVKVNRINPKDLFDVSQL